MNAYSERLASAQVFNVAMEQWTRLPPMRAPRANLALASIDRIIYAVGGDSDLQGPASIEAFNPITGSWTSLKPMSTTRSHFQLAVAESRIYVIGGRNAT